ncbi:hypothetical protein M378DRAFT_17465 [Amanita muscaria Koide BX008]|uniref:Uncharacterized protein n=1 Tax=Amanita muscaria (strain Koide BX008) TaxID=946122 RepID=A0A0C2SPV6_AMAMK|nr:hypothetical protein M378DRAFT_17465 [Amanita muscaria Koide BX008]
MTDGKIEYDNSVYREQTPVDVADESMKTDIAEQPTEIVAASSTATGSIFNESAFGTSNVLWEPALVNGATSSDIHGCASQTTSAFTVFETNVSLDTHTAYSCSSVSDSKATQADAARIVRDFDQHLAKKRIRGRVSADHRPPRTDDQLAQRLKEVHILPLKSVPLRDPFTGCSCHSCSPSSRITKNTHIAGHEEKKETVPSLWQIWLSMNPNSGATAIWMERKFDVPDSGMNRDIGRRSISSLYLPPQTPVAQKGSLGIVIFKCMPIQNVKDDIERSVNSPGSMLTFQKLIIL